MDDVSTVGAELSLRDATEADIGPLVTLIQSAYRGESSRTGWTTEADLLDGQRTDPEGVRDVIDSSVSRMLVAERDGTIVACCQLEHRGDAAYFGMFAVDPGAQGGGLGRTVLEHAERTAAQAWGVSTMQLTVITAREDRSPGTSGAAIAGPES